VILSVRGISETKSTLLDMCDPTQILELKMRNVEKQAGGACVNEGLWRKNCNETSRGGHSGNI
jgi:hypothetical protein